MGIHRSQRRKATESEFSVSVSVNVHISALLCVFAREKLEFEKSVKSVDRYTLLAETESRRDGV